MSCCTSPRGSAPTSPSAPAARRSRSLGDGVSAYSACPRRLRFRRSSPWGSIGRLGGNDFEGVVFAKHPRLRDLYEGLAGTGPVWVRLCGSGSAVAAVYKKESERNDAAERLGEQHQQLIRTVTRADVAPAPQPLED